MAQMAQLITTCSCMRSTRLLLVCRVETIVVAEVMLALQTVHRVTSTPPLAAVLVLAPWLSGMLRQAVSTHSLAAEALSPFRARPNVGARD